MLHLYYILTNMRLVGLMVLVAVSVSVPWMTETEERWSVLPDIVSVSASWKWIGVGSMGRWSEG